MTPSKSVAFHICAVIVTYHPSPDMVENMSNVLAQTDGLVVVDNGSKIDEISPLRKASQNHGFQLIENGVNLGIAEALNQGVRWARANGFSWVILFDQDRSITPGFIGNMFLTWESHPQRERVGSVQPRY